MVVADSTGCNGSASRLTRRTRLDLSTYRKHREREEDKRRPRFSFTALLYIIVLSFALFSLLLFAFLAAFPRHISLVLSRLSSVRETIGERQTGGEGESERQRERGQEGEQFVGGVFALCIIVAFTVERYSQRPLRPSFSPQPSRSLAKLLWLACWLSSDPCSDRDPRTWIVQVRLAPYSYLVRMSFLIRQIYRPELLRSFIVPVATTTDTHNAHKLYDYESGAESDNLGSG